MELVERGQLQFLFGAAAGGRVRELGVEWVRAEGTTWAQEGAWAGERFRARAEERWGWGGSGLGLFGSFFSFFGVLLGLFHNPTVFLTIETIKGTPHNPIETLPSGQHPT